MKEKIKIEEITLERAWEIAREFSKVVGENKLHIYQFEDFLPYEKDIILFSLVKILKDSDFKKLAISNNTTEEAIKNIVATMIDSLSSFIPNQEQYKKMLELKKMGEGMNNLGEEFTDEQFRKFIETFKKQTS